MALTRNGPRRLGLAPAAKGRTRGSGPRARLDGRRVRKRIARAAEAHGKSAVRTSQRHRDDCRNIARARAAAPDDRNGPLAGRRSKAIEVEARDWPVQAI